MLQNEKASAQWGKLRQSANRMACQYVLQMHAETSY